MSICWWPRIVGGGELSAEVGLKRQNQDVEGTQLWPNYTDPNRSD